MITVSFQNVGAPNTPQEVKRFRRQVMDMCRKLGEPVVWRHQWNNADKEAGIAKLCPACFNDEYGQVRGDCEVCYAVGFVSVEDSDANLYINQQGYVVTGDPGTGLKAPKYGGYGPPYLTWLMEPDVGLDVFKINEQGVMVQTQNAEGYAPWFPQMGDNDLIINIHLAKDGGTILDDEDRYQLKMVQPMTVRGWGVQTRAQEHTAGQSFQMSKAPINTIFYRVPVNP